MKRAPSAATTRSQAKARCAPIPAAVPLTAAIDRLLAVEHGRDEPLGAAPDHARGVAHDPVGSALGAGRGGAAAGAEVGAGAEPLAGGGEDDGPDLDLGARILEELDDTRSRWSAVMALRTSGRLSVIHDTRFSTRWSTCSSSGWSDTASSSSSVAGRSPKVCHAGSVTGRAD